MGRAAHTPTSTTSTPKKMEYGSGICRYLRIMGDRKRGDAQLRQFEERKLCYSWCVGGWGSICGGICKVSKNTYYMREGRLRISAVCIKGHDSS